MEEFFNSSEKIMQRSKFKGARTHSICKPEQRPADRLPGRPACTTCTGAAQSTA